MRQIEFMTATVAQLLTRKETSKPEQYGIVQDISESQSEQLSRLLALVRQGRICEAEDLLFERIDPSDEGWMSVALEFYTELNRLSNDELESHNFSREEVSSGLESVCAMYGLDLSLFRSWEGW